MSHLHIPAADATGVDVPRCLLCGAAVEQPTCTTTDCTTTASRMVDGAYHCVTHANEVATETSVVTLATVAS